MKTQTYHEFAIALVVALSIPGVINGSPFASTMTTSLTILGNSSDTCGINLGHRFTTDYSWISILKYFGVNSARSFGMNGLGTTSTLQSFATQSSGTWGNSMNGTAVTDLASFQAAVAELRKPDGHNPAQALHYAYPVRWSQIDNNMATTDLTSAASALQGNPLNTITELNSIGVNLLSTQWLTCSNFAFSTLDPTQSIYWGERFELYKHQYALSTWSYKRGITKFEYWNEPDLNAACITNSSWLEHVTLRPLAIRDAFTDANTDVQAGVYACEPTAKCPLTPNILASAFAQSTFASAALWTAANPEYAGQTVSGRNLQFPPYLNITNSSVVNWNSFSFHSYGALRLCFAIYTIAFALTFAFL